MEKNLSTALAPKISAALIIAGILLLGLMLVSFTMGGITLFVFLVTDSLDYYADYIILMGYEPVVNMLFMNNYTLFFVGSLGIPFLGSGLLTHFLGNKNNK